MGLIFLGRFRPKRGYGELCRFTIRELIRPRLLTQWQAAARVEVCLKCRDLNLGRAWGKVGESSPRQGLRQKHGQRIFGEAIAAIGVPL